MAIGETGHSTQDPKGERFELRRLLGSGAQGMVYEAFDTAHGATVALKVLQRVEPHALFQFKAEFRALSNLTHPNLLQLFELTMVGDEYVLAMELVVGADFLSYVRSAGPVVQEVDADEDTGDAVEALRRASLPPEPSRRSMRASAPRPTVQLSALDETKLRDALGQLAEGLHALHRSGRLHRDLKPANVLVFTADGRVVLCDFGLVIETAARRERIVVPTDTPRGGGTTTHHKTEIAGSLAFMSPEQSVGGTLAPATDWYAVGVMLYQALTGRVPFSPKLDYAAAVHAKHELTPVHPLVVDEHVPPDLADLAMQLLLPDVVKRAGYADVVRVVQRPVAPANQQAVHSMPATFLIGRGPQLAQLSNALALTSGGQATLCLLSGYSGMGKSALARQFLSDCEDKHAALVLRSRCYECEELPFKVFDPLLDSLTQHLVTLEGDRLAALLPPDTSWLATLFPTLRRVEAIALLAPIDVAATDPFERKRRAFGALREICRRLAQTRPLILFVDDMQWGDVDSGGPLLELLREPNAPAILFLASYRAEDRERSALLRELRDHHLPAAGAGHVEQIVLASLDDDDARALAVSLLGPAHDAAIVELLVKEAAGSPFFLRELARYVSRHGANNAHSLRLGTIIQAEIAALSPDGQTMMDVVAVAGRPETRAALQLASALGSNMFRTTQVLEARSLIVATGTQAGDKIEPYHDRIRETHYQGLHPERRHAVHRSLAQALETCADRAGVARDAEALFGHWRNGQDAARATHYAVLAAERAEQSLAFGRAADLFQGALQLTHGEPERARWLEGRRGTALMFCGRGAEAADAFLRAMKGAPAERATELRGMAMTQLLGSGHLDRAFDELVRAEDALGLKFPRTNLRAVLMLLWRKLRIRLDDSTVRVLPDAAITAASLRRVDDLYRVATALSTVDFLRGGVYTAEATVRALETGDPTRLACALAIEAIRSSSENKKPEKTQWIIDRGAALAELSGDPYALAATRGTAGISRYLEGRFVEAVQLTRETQKIHREQLHGTRAWDYWTQLLFELRSAAELGDLRDLIKRVPETVRDAEERGDLYTKNMARVARLTWAWLAPDQLDVAREQVALAEREWVQDGYQLMHYYRLMSRTEIALYDGGAHTCQAAWSELVAAWKPMLLVRKIHTCRVQALYMRARLALQLAQTSADPKLLRAARTDAKALLAEGSPWTWALGQLVSGCAASFESEARALPFMQAAKHAFESQQMVLYAAVADYTAGRWMHGAQGDELCLQAQLRMQALGVAAPASFVRMLTPAR